MVSAPAWLQRRRASVLMLLWCESVFARMPRRQRESSWYGPRLFQGHAASRSLERSHNCVAVTPCEAENASMKPVLRSDL
jgi:hypothetical protein